MPEEQNIPLDPPEELTLELHKEELQVSKKIIETGKVNIYKNTYTEERQILIPVIHEELIIEKKIINSDNTVDPKVETIRIPLTEERIEITKHPIVLENVEIDKKKIIEHFHLDELLKEEKLRIDTVGDITLTMDQDL
ncbi:YsnF/AvaK domain-containing protein [Bacillus sp. JJ1764]|uniref:YsnF/AvaK domain-containing protein n=1 Tax=Bacillus sp. JJ1764 TaxID=3122964 RepID=UPI002FFEBA3C